jgi:DNA-binding CsgD family transcriptional regulator
MHDGIETVFEALEVVWPRGVARRTGLVAAHLDRSIAALSRLDDPAAAAPGPEAILAHVHTAVLTVGPGLRLGFANPAAEALLRRGDGLRLRDGHLKARWPAEERTLAAAVSGAFGTGPRPRSGEAAAGAAAVLVAVGRGEDRPPYRVSVLPLRPGRAARALAPGTQAILFVDDPDRDAAPPRAALYERAFDLTPAEARLAVHLAAGASLTEAAEAFGVTHNTVRAQLRAIFDKTDTHRQSDLVRLLQGPGSLRVRLA